MRTDHHENRKRYAAALNSLEKYDGKYAKKLGEKSIQNIQEAVEKCNLTSQHVQTYDGKKIDLSILRRDLEHAETMIYLQDKLESCPALEEVIQAKARLDKAIKQLREEYGQTADTDLRRTGITNWTINHF